MFILLYTEYWLKSKLIYSLNLFKDKQLDFEMKMCLLNNESAYEYFLIKIWFWLDIMLYSVIPFVSIGICSLVIAKKLSKVNKNYTKYLTKSRLMNESCCFNKKIYRRKVKRNFHLCLMLVSADVYFLLTMLVFWLWAFFQLNSENNEFFFYKNLTQSYVYVLLYSNNALSFLFYGILSINYRREFFRIFRFKRQFSSRAKNTLLFLSKNRSTKKW